MPARECSDPPRRARNADHLANARHNTISRANARLWITRVEHTKEGEQLRRFYELKLDRSDHPIFALSWNLGSLGFIWYLRSGRSPLRLSFRCDATLGAVRRHPQGRRARADQHRHHQPLGQPATTCER
jgi:hypothetical protein